MEAANRMFSEGRVLSITGLESYAACPFRYFLRNVLRVRPLDEPEQQLRMPRNEVGSLMHNVLEQFIGALPEGGLDPSSVLSHHANCTNCRERARRGRAGGRGGVSAALACRSARDRRRSGSLA